MLRPSSSLSNLLTPLRRSLRGPAPGSCELCRHFSNDPRTLEREIPGLATMSSGDAAVRDRDGLCAVHQRLTAPRSHCREFQEHELREADGSEKT
jgi:hypothetical protein